MSLRSQLQIARTRVLPALLATVVMTAVLPLAAAASEPGVELLTGTPWSTDLDASGTTDLNDFAIFGCSFLGGTCPACPHEDCMAGPPFPCDAACPLMDPPCDCGSGVPVSKSNFSCDGNGAVGLADFATFSVGFLAGTLIGKCD